MKPWEVALALVVLYLLLRDRQRCEPATSSSPAFAPPLRERQSSSRGGGEVPPLRTGGTDPDLWIATRFAATVDDLVRRGVDATAALKGARGLVAQWALETNAGKSEYNYNLGGWKAASGEPFQVIRNAGTGEADRWAAFPSLEESVHEHIERLQRPRFRQAFASFIADPLSDDWVRELGHAGYYGEPPDQYARAWRTRLSQVSELTRGAA